MAARAGGFVVCATVAFISAGCLDVSLPPIFPRGPGTLRASVMTLQPGRSSLMPAVGARATLTGTSEVAFTDDDGNFVLRNVLSSEGSALVEFDADGNATTDLSRLISLRAVGAGFGKDINLGQLILGRPASIVGTVRRGGLDGGALNHGEIVVFTPGLAARTLTAPDGRYTLDGVPQGATAVAFWAQGYVPVSVGILPESGAKVTLADVTLEPAPAASAVFVVGRVVSSASTMPLPGARVVVNERTAATDADGRFSLALGDEGLVDLTVRAEGHRSLQVRQLLALSGRNDVGDLTLSTGVDTLDAGTSRDAGTADAGSVDAGEADAGSSGIDAGTDGGSQPRTGLSLTGHFDTTREVSGGTLSLTGGISGRKRVCTGTLCLRGGIQ